MTVDGVPGSSPPSITISARRRISSGTSASARGSGPPAWLALDWSTGQRTPASAGTSTTRSPSVPGSPPQASGKRAAGLGSSSDTGPGSSRSQRRHASRAELRERLQRELAVEEHDRRGLVERAALEPVQALDGRRGSRGRRRGRRRCRMGTPRRRRPTCSARTSPPPARSPLPLLALRATTTRSRPLRSGRTSTSPNPAPRIRSVTAAPCDSPISSSAQSRPRARGQLIDAGGGSRRARPSPPNSASDGSNPATSTGSSASRSTYGRLARTASAGGAPSSRSPTVKLTSRSRSARVARRRPQSPSALTSTAAHHEVRTLGGERERDRAAARPDVEHAGARTAAARRRPRPAPPSPGAGSAPCQSTVSSSARNGRRPIR